MTWEVSLHGPSLPNRRDAPTLAGGYPAPLEPLEPRVLLSGSAAGAPSSEVVARHIFYNNSAYDGNSVLADANDDAAIAVDKAALLPGERATFANYTSYTRGINGVMVDLSADPGRPITTADFEFRVGNGDDPGRWSTGPAPASVTVREGAAPSAPIRVTLTWRDGAIRNRWLQVTVKANENTGLASDDVFFFGNLVGESGRESSAARVTSGDRPPAGALFGVSDIDNRYDYDRSGYVDGADVLAYRRNLYRQLHLPASFTGAGMGLAATYFDDPEFGGVTTRRVDRTVDFAWQGGSPAPDIEPYTYSVRWSGQIRPAHSEQYTFYTTSNDGVRLWVDGQPVIDNWTNHRATENEGEVILDGGRKYDIRLEYYQHLGTAVIKLEWSSPSLSRQVIPTDRLYPAAPEAPAVEPTDPVPPALPGDWRMIFNDEFEGTELNPVWRTAQYWDSEYTVVGHGGELQAYDATGVSVSDGMLRLTAREETKYGMPYVSGLVQTGGRSRVTGEPRFNFKYGYLEVRARLAPGQGLWSAIWMLPASHNDDNGELDVMELIGSEPTNANFVVHRYGERDGHDWLGANLTRTFHTFAVDWQSDHIAWYVDGVERFRTTDPRLICPEAMYPILNVAVGGDWPGAPDETTVFPASMDVDYVRVWQTSPDE